MGKLSPRKRKGPAWGHTEGQLQPSSSFFPNPLTPPPCIKNPWSPTTFFELLTPSFLTSAPCSSVPNSLWGYYHPDVSCLLPEEGRELSQWQTQFPTCPPWLNSIPWEGQKGEEVTVLTPEARGCWSQHSVLVKRTRDLAGLTIRVTWPCSPEIWPQVDAEISCRQRYH